MLARAAASIGLEVNKPPSPEPSQLDDWFLGAGRGSQPRPTPVPFFPEVHEELTKSRMAPFTARSRSSVSSVLTTLDGGAARGYAGIPQVERAVAVHLCLRNAATWRNRPCLPSKACKLTAALAAKAYSAVGQAASALHAMAILHVHQAKALKEMHEGSFDPGLIRLGKAMSTMVVQEHHLWLDLAEIKDVDKARFHGDVGVCSFSGDDEDSVVPSPGGGPGGESYVPLYFCSATYSKKEQFPFPPGFQVRGPTVCDALPPHSRPRPILPVAKRAWFGDAVPPHAPLASPLWDPGSSAWMLQNARCLLYHPALLPFAAPPQVRQLYHWCHLRGVWKRGLRCPARLVGSRAQFDSATRFSLPGDLPSSAAFLRLRWQLGTLLSCARRLLSSWQMMQSSRSLQPR